MSAYVAEITTQCAGSLVFHRSLWEKIAGTPLEDALHDAANHIMLPKDGEDFHFSEIVSKTTGKIAIVDAPEISLDDPCQWGVRSGAKFPSRILHDAPTRNTNHLTIIARAVDPEHGFARYVVQATYPGKKTPSDLLSPHAQQSRRNLYESIFFWRRHAFTSNGISILTDTKSVASIRQKLTEDGCQIELPD